MNSAKWEFWCRDNSGKYQCFKVSATSKKQAIDKGFIKARKNATGDIIPSSWGCRLIMA